jgi:hypothetical protein
MQSDLLNDPVYPTLSANQVRELISRRAYEIYTQRETGSADELSDWLTAEAEVVTMLLTDPQETVELKDPKGPAAARPRTVARVSKAANGARQRVSRWSKRKTELKSNPA